MTTVRFTGNGSTMSAAGVRAIARMSAAEFDAAMTRGEIPGKVSGEPLRFDASVITAWVASRARWRRGRP